MTKPKFPSRRPPQSGDADWAREVGAARKAGADFVKKATTPSGKRDLGPVVFGGGAMSKPGPAKSGGKKYESK